jgi:hypothetical protein
MMKEVKNIAKKNSIKDPDGLSSSHQMAAEACVRRMREYLRKKKEEKRLLLMIETQLV